MSSAPSPLPAASPRDAIAGQTSSSASGPGNLSGWLKSKAASLEGHVKEIRENAQLAAQEIADGVQKGITASKVNLVEERYEVTFIERALGLELDLSKGAVVRAVKPGGQGERLQVQAQDRLAAISGEPLPPFSENEGQEAVEQFIQEVQTRMKSMGRPVNLTFARMIESVVLVEDASDQLMGAVKKRLTKLPGGFGDAPAAELLAELQAAREIAQRCEAEVVEAREEAKQQVGDAIAAVEEAAQLRADLADLQLSKVWNTQEAQRCSAEAEVARAEATKAQDALAASAGEMQRLRDERAVAEQAAAAERRETAAQKAEVEHLRVCLAEAEARAVDLQRSREQLERSLADSKQQLNDSEADLLERVRLASASAEAAHARTAETDKAMEAAREEIRIVEQREEAASKRVEELVAEVAAARADAPRLVAAERLVTELRREVERLRKEVQLFQSAAGGVGGIGMTSAVDTQAEARIAELQLEIERLREALSRQEVALHSQAGGVSAPPSPDKVEGCTVLAGPSPEEPKEVEGHQRSPAAEPGYDVGPTTAAAEPREPRASGLDALPREKALEVRLAELEEQNAALTRQLNARPIVFQFAPSPDEDDIDEAALEEDDDAAEEAPPAPLPLHGTVSGVEATRRASNPVIRTDNGGVRYAAMAYGAALWCKRRTKRGFAFFRKLRQAQSLERTLRSFTRKMLQSPVLLWLFYVHVLVLWCIEGWRQAVSQTLPMDPTERINQKMVESAAAALPVSAAAAPPKG